MSRETENLLLLLIGVSGLTIAITGAYTRYVKPSLLPYLVAGAVLIVVLAASAMLRDFRNGGPYTDADGHSHSSTVVWLLIVPVIVLTFIKPPPIGAHSVDTTVAAVSTDVLRRPFPPLPDRRAPEIVLPEVLVRVSQDTAGTLDDRLITVIGFTLREGAQTDLARIVLFCCAADARLARIHLAGPAAPDAARLPDESWIRVEGTVPPGQGDTTGLTIPTMTVLTVTPIPEPENPYAF